MATNPPELETSKPQDIALKDLDVKAFQERFFPGWELSELQGGLSELKLDLESGEYVLSIRRGHSSDVTLATPGAGVRLEDVTRVILGEGENYIKFYGRDNPGKLDFMRSQQVPGWSVSLVLPGGGGNTFIPGK